MSIAIDRELCLGCGACSQICPGGLISADGGTASVKRPERCWGCASCVKECPRGAIGLYLGADMGGLGGIMTVRREDARLYWTIRLPGGSEKTIFTDSRDANKY